MAVLQCRPPTYLKLGGVGRGVSKSQKVLMSQMSAFPRVEQALLGLPVHTGNSTIMFLFWRDSQETLTSLIYCFLKETHTHTHTGAASFTPHRVWVLQRPAARVSLLLNGTVYPTEHLLVASPEGYSREEVRSLTLNSELTYPVK